MADGTDYTEVDPFLTFFEFPAADPTDPPEERTHCFNVTIASDSVYEELEHFTLQLDFDPIFGEHSGVKIDPSVTTIFIEDDNC